MSEGSRVNTSRLDKLAGYLAAFAMLFTFGLGSAAVQALEREVPQFQLSAARYAVQVVVYYLLARFLRVSFSTVTRPKVPYLLLLAAIDVASNIGIYGAASYLPLSETSSISTTVSMLAAAAQAWLLFRQTPRHVDLLAILVCTLGILLISQPPALFGSPAMAAAAEEVPSRLLGNDTTTLARNVNEPQRNVVGYVLIMIGGVAVGLEYDIVAVLLSDIPSLVNVLLVSCFGFLSSLILGLYVEEFQVFLSLRDFGYLMGHCFAACVSNLLYFYSALRIGGIHSAVIHSLQVCVNLGLQYTILRSILPGHRNWMEPVGALINVFGAVLVPLLYIIKEYRVGGGDML